MVVVVVDFVPEAVRVHALPDVLVLVVHPVVVHALVPMVPVLYRVVDVLVIAQRHVRMDVPLALLAV